ncbi:extracellular solute-binding protein [Leadbettera azotonutricia]|uniref:Putative lipoprotein n=1 Tax=Leadbettera azotonutricia (strain ATCC BAA-888 / DSM 13862 / ZAS-9) TaxID=545695 RepID=F5Y7R5_LEAAZ|nr:extracellular solute-binding protein [Leadbettera azotonutricia]AEF82107.1 putative lipoprotein [Leadbettera azotonutricia ZAS-9]
MAKFDSRALTGLFVLLAVLPGLASCGNGDNRAAVLWTDRPEFTFYAEQFNDSQDKYKVEARYFESPAQKLTDGNENPDIVAASWLKSASTRALFLPLDSLLNRETISQSAFYPRLLALGSIEGRQYLLPVAFNIPAMVFARDHSQLLSNPFTIDMEEIMDRGKAYNTDTNGVYTRMGFSPSWNDEFLFIAVTLFNTGFREAAPLAWDPQALERALVWIQKWINEANTSIQAEDDFAFKYLYDPPAKLVSSGRIFFTYMDSSEFFTLAEDRRTNLHFRWIAEKDVIPLDEWSVYYGIHKKTKAKKAATAFTEWFFQAETQRRLLDAAKAKRLLENSFGIGGGFSAMRTVTEQIFPHFYPSLLGHMPPESFLSPPNILPRNWMTLKERVILPYLHDKIRHAERDEVRHLERRITDWYRLNRE